MKKIILNQNTCIDEIETTIKKQGWEIVDKKYDFFQPYVGTFDSLNYEAKIDFYIAFKTPSNFIHKIYCFFLEFDTNNIFKISEIKSPEHPQGQMTTRIADFKYYNTTDNLGFSPYKITVSGQQYNLSHNYHSFFNSLVAKEKNNELNYVCIILKYDNHAQSKKRLRYYVNSYKKFIKSFLLKLEKFEIRKTRALLKAEILKGQKQKAKLNKNKKSSKVKATVVKTKAVIPIQEVRKKSNKKVDKTDKKNIKIKNKGKSVKDKSNIKAGIIKHDNSKTVVVEGKLKTIFDHKNMTIKVIKENTKK